MEQNESKPSLDQHGSAKNLTWVSSVPSALRVTLLAVSGIHVWPSLVAYRSVWFGTSSRTASHPRRPLYERRDGTGVDASAGRVNTAALPDPSPFICQVPKFV